MEQIRNKILEEAAEVCDKYESYGAAYEIRMMKKPENISHIAKEVLRTGEVSKEQVSELAKMTAKQIYSQGYQAGEMASKIDTWNEAIEAAAIKADNCGEVFLIYLGTHYESIGEFIRELKK